MIKAKLTGAADATTDLDIPATAITLTYNNGSVYGRITAAYASDSIDEINARPNGDLAIYRSIDGAFTLWSTLNFDGFDYSRGVRSASLSYSGYTTETNPTPQTVTPGTLISSGLNSYGERTWSIDELTVVKPLDSVIINAETIPIRQVEIVVSPKTFSHVITEQL